jgi:hypothetical protein
LEILTPALGVKTHAFMTTDGYDSKEQNQIEIAANNSHKNIFICRDR